MGDSNVDIHVATLQAWREGHEKSDDERHRKYEADVAAILQTMSDMKQILEHSNERVHERIDNVQRIARKDTEDINERVTGLVRWFMTSAIIVLSSIVAFFTAPFFKGPAN